MWEQVAGQVPSLSVILALLVATCFMATFAAAIYVCYRFLAVIVTIDAAFSRGRAITGELKNPVLFPQVAAKPSSNDGTAEPYDEEQLYLAEQVRRVKGQGLSDEELQKFIAHARGLDMEFPETKG